MTSEVQQYRTRLFQSQERTVRMYNPDMTEEQIQERCAQLRNHIINSEENRPLDERFTKIWGRKIRPR